MFILHGHNHIHVKPAQSTQTNKTLSHERTSSYRIHVQICPLAGPLVTAPESLFLKSPPSSALVLTLLGPMLWLRTSPLNDVIPEGPPSAPRSLAWHSVRFSASTGREEGTTGDAGWRCLISVLTRGGLSSGGPRPAAWERQFQLNRLGRIVLLPCPLLGAGRRGPVACSMAVVISLGPHELAQ